MQVNREHCLKTLPVYWDAVACGDKTFEVRKNDRGFQRGDILVLQRLPDPATQHIAVGEVSLRLQITYVLPGGAFGIDPDVAVLGLGPEPRHQERPA